MLPVPPLNALNLADMWVNEAIATRITGAAAEITKPQLIAVMPLRSPTRGDARKMPVTARRPLNAGGDQRKDQAVVVERHLARISVCPAHSGPGCRT
jgi:hypothetical protein